MKKHHRFSRLESLIGKDNLILLSNKSVVVVGLGGVGGYVCEGLCRSGIGKIIIIDHDNIDVTNLNRQIIALNSTLGKKKVEMVKKRILDINPNCEVVVIDKFLTDSNINLLDSVTFDFLVDACDTIQTKKEIISYCLFHNIKFITCLGTAKKLDPSKLEITDIRKTYNDPLARILRKYVKDKKINRKIPVLFSSEVPIPCQELGSSFFVPSSAGILISSYVVRNILEKK